MLLRHPRTEFLNVNAFMRHLRPLLALAACSAALSSAGRRPATPGARPTLSRKALLQAFLVTTLAPRRADAVDCLGEAEGPTIDKNHARHLRGRRRSRTATARGEDHREAGLAAPPGI